MLMNYFPAKIIVFLQISENHFQSGVSQESSGSCHRNRWIQTKCRASSISIVYSHKEE